MRVFSILALLVSCFAASLGAQEFAQGKPWESGVISVESGLLWKVGTGTRLSYRLVPTQLSWRSPVVGSWDMADGSKILFRHRLTVLGTWIQQGPESHYFAIDGSPSLEWWNAAGTWALYSGIGGGAGVIDSRGVRGGQGQDFTFNWFMRGGIEHVISKRSTVTAGIMFQHMSNGGQTKPNPGIDAVGFILGYSRVY